MHGASRPRSPFSTCACRPVATAAEAIRALDSRLDIVIATAYSSTDPAELSRRILPASRTFYVQKPFHPHEIHQLAHAVGGKRRTEDVIHRLAYYDGRTLLECADMAMYNAKASVIDKLCVHDRSTNETAMRRMSPESRARNASTIGACRPPNHRKRRTL